VGIVIGPAVLHTNPIERPFYKPQTIARVGIRSMPLRVVARGIVITVFEEIDIMAEASKPHYILQMMPCHTSQRSTNNIAEYDDT
jgi:hypothetical protein